MTQAEKEELIALGFTEEEIANFEDLGWSAAEIKGLFAPEGKLPTAEYNKNRDIYSRDKQPYTGQGTERPQPLGQPHTGRGMATPPPDYSPQPPTAGGGTDSTQRPSGVSDFTWNQYLLAEKAYKAAEQDLGNPQKTDDLGNPSREVTTKFNRASIARDKVWAQVNKEVAEAAKAPKSPVGEPKSGFYAPPTTAPKLFNYETGEWEDNRGYVPPREPQGPSPYASDFTKGPTRYRYNAQGIPEPVFTFPEEEERPTPYQQWTMGAKWDYDKEQDRIQREQQQAQQELAQRQAAWRAASDVIGQQQQMAPYALRPGQTHFSSYGPGEAWSNLYPWLGLPYNPDSFKLAPVNIDWEKQFRKTQELMGGK